jgi:hypothetical protein
MAGSPGLTLIDALVMALGPLDAAMAGHGPEEAHCSRLALKRYDHQRAGKHFASPTSEAQPGGGALTAEQIEVLGPALADYLEHRLSPAA